MITFFTQRKNLQKDKDIFSTLPKEIIPLIANYLDATDMRNFCMASKFVYENFHLTSWYLLSQINYIYNSLPSDVKEGIILDSENLPKARLEGIYEQLKPFYSRSDFKRTAIENIKQDVLIIPIAASSVGRDFQPDPERPAHKYLQCIALLLCVITILIWICSGFLSPSNLDKIVIGILINVAICIGFFHMGDRFYSCYRDNINSYRERVTSAQAQFTEVLISIPEDTSSNTDTTLYVTEVVEEEKKLLSTGRESSRNYNTLRL